MVLTVENTALNTDLQSPQKIAIAKTQRHWLAVGTMAGLVVGLLGTMALPANAALWQKETSKQESFEVSLSADKITTANRTAAKTAVEIGEETNFSGGDFINAESSQPVDFGAITNTGMTELTETDGTTVILPPGYNASRSYPALVLMPYTDRTALHMFNWGIYESYHRTGGNSAANAFVIIMPPGQGSSANWSGSGWESLVSEYEAYVQQDLDPIAARYNVDPNQMVIGGFSLGGDLSWTLSLRNPGMFSGAIVMGSMSNYRNDESAKLLANRDFRYFMVMGGYDGNRGAMYNALDTLDTHNIAYHYEEVAHAGHGDLPEQMPNNLFLSAMDYVLTDPISGLLSER